jgi:alkanesulfonate monooxygenase SsuD/methylene tetrahydromethanopterin reductase-like flavin-dependent oxidoreductase (luciferase family)
VTEKFYGRTARLFVMQSEEDSELGATLAQISVRRAAEEIGPAGNEETLTQSLVHARLSEADARRFARRLSKLVDEFRAREIPEGANHGLVTGLYRMR